MARRASILVLFCDPEFGKGRQMTGPIWWFNSDGNVDELIT
jgi:hypothetical protein